MSRKISEERRDVERLLDAARGPALPHELAGEHAMVELFTRARLPSSTTPALQETTMSTSPRTGVKAAVAAAAAVGLLSTGAAFAASGHAPWSAVSAASASSTHPVHPTRPTGETNETTEPEESSEPTEASEAGEDSTESGGPNVHAFGGLCRAYASGDKTEHGRALKSPAFAALVAAAGGVDNVATFCSAVSSGPSRPHPTHPSHPTQAATPTHPTQRMHSTPRTHRAHPTAGGVTLTAGPPRASDASGHADPEADGQAVALAP